MKSIVKNGKVVVALASVLALSGLASVAHAAFGDSAAGTRGAQFLKLGVGARAIGMGEAYTAVADDSNAIYYNVAGLAFAEKKSAEYMYSKYVEETNYHWIAFGMPISEKHGSAGVAIQYFSAGDIDKTDVKAVKSGSFAPSDMAINLAYAHKVFGSDHSAGVNLKIINSKIDNSATAFAVDLGLQCRKMMEGKLLLGLAFQNIGSSLKYDTDDTKLPILVKLGSGYKVMDNWTAALDLVFPEDSAPVFALGTDYKYQIQENMTLSGRLGYNSKSRQVGGFNGVTIGFGLGFQMASLDYAWMPLGDLGSAHRISLGVKF